MSVLGSIAGGCPCEESEVGVISQVIIDHIGVAYAQVHRWLEKTAFFKMPRSQEAELVAEMKQPFEDVRPHVLHISYKV